MGEWGRFLAFMHAGQCSPVTVLAVSVPSSESMDISRSQRGCPL